MTFPPQRRELLKWTKEYLDSKGPQHRLIFLVDEVGQFIGSDQKLMVNLQTIMKGLGTHLPSPCAGDATSGRMDAVLGDMTGRRKGGFLQDSGPFLPASVALQRNVDEVIQSRLLAKIPDVKDEFGTLFQKKGDILKNQLTFKNCGMTFRPFKDGEDFVKNYPFAPYQFQLLQKIFEAIRRAGATGINLAKGEPSMLDASRRQRLSRSTNRHSGSFCTTFIRPIESFLDTSVKKTIDQAETNSSLEPFPTFDLLQVLFLIRYVDEMKGNVDNLVTLSFDEIDGDRWPCGTKSRKAWQDWKRKLLLAAAVKTTSSSPTKNVT